jgi:hypothetical protein
VRVYPRLLGRGAFEGGASPHDQVIVPVISSAGPDRVHAGGVDGRDEPGQGAQGGREADEGEGRDVGNRW